MTDKVSFTSVTADQSSGAITPAAAVTVSCRIEDTNKTFKNDQGEIIEANSLIMWPSNVSIKKGDKVKITEIMGVTKTGEVDYKVEEVMPAGGFMVSHLEVYI